MRGDLVKGLIVLAVLSFLAFTPPGRTVLGNVIDWVSDTVATWAAERITDIGNEDEPAGTGWPARGKCGDVEPPIDAKVSESEAIRIAVKFWGRKQKIPCSDVEAEFSRDNRKLRWLVELPAGRSCRLTALIDASTGEPIKGGGGCP